ncbi:uncharacterized protein LOC126834585 [Adelges cooleyi]|uniref:uncharacterized protein LOC126834585 n=1 Tax=Adelges cooleyi TaxID=133065 RepID=UPI0021808E73|nr:uncharacterized protein LOC126834585 [Adelges cooleyi]
MNNRNEPNEPGTSRGPADQNPADCPKKEASRLNNNVVNGYGDTQCCANCDSAARRDHMIAASLVYCDQEESDTDDDCCYYRYRGDRREPAVDDRLRVDDRSASPLMDYLEMDFDPEPTVENESENEELDAPDPVAHQTNPMIDSDVPMPSCSGVSSVKECNNCENKNSMNNSNISQPTASSSLQFTDIYNNIKEERNGCIRRNADAMEVCQNMKRMRVDDLGWVKEMVWSEKEAAQRQVSQIGVSACGATAVINALLALRIPFSTDRVVRTISTRLRNETGPLVSYLESRSVAGCMAEDLVRTLETATDSLVSARFFATNPIMDVPLATWLAGWIKKGAVPILTLNLQRGVKSLVPDSWHHQMVYGVSYNPLRPDECAQIYMSNPLTMASVESLRPQLFSPSLLMVRRTDVLSRWTPHTDLMSLASHPDPCWHAYNVLGQVVNLIREEQEGVQFTKHIVIPASYKSGITLALQTASNYSHELKSVPEL